MTADIRMALEDDLDNLVEGQVESWIQRCFESCDPRYESDWLNGMFELAMMQFPDNYELRAASSRAATMEAQRLHDEGDSQEAIARLERLLESDPYCTEAFELLEKFIQNTAPPSQEPAPVTPAPVPPEPVVEAPAASPVSVPEPQFSAPAVQIDSLVSGDEELLSFLEENVLEEIIEPVVPEIAEPAAPAVAETPPEPVVVEPPAPPVSSLEPPPPFVADTPPVVQETPPPVVSPPPVVAVSSPSVASSSAFDWRSVIALPAHGSNTIEAQLEALIPSLTERFTQIRNYRGLALLLTDLFQRDPGHAMVSQALNSVLRDWSLYLESQGRGPEAGQVAAWSQQLLGGRAEWAAGLMQKYPSQPPSLPDLGSLAGVGAPAWMSWVNSLKDQPGRFEEAGAALLGDPQGLQSLFRHLAVHHPNHPEHVLNLGWAYSQTGQPALAMVHTQRALQLRPSARGYQLLQKVYTDLGQTELAQRVSQQLAQLKA